MKITIEKIQKEAREQRECAEQRRQIDRQRDKQKSQKAECDPKILVTDLSLPAQRGMSDGKDA